MHQVEELVRRQAPWSETLALVSAAAPHGFLIYHTLEVGAVLTLAGHRSGDAAYLMGNHVIAERMYRHDPGVMLHAPLRTLIWEGLDASRGSASTSRARISEATEAGDRRPSQELGALGPEGVGVRTASTPRSSCGATGLATLVAIGERRPPDGVVERQPRRAEHTRPGVAVSGRG